LATISVNVVVTREAGKNDSLRELIPPGARVDEVPLTRTVFIEPDEVRTELAASSAYGAFRSLVVTSERSAEYVEIALSASTPDAAVYSVGPATTAALSDRGVRVTRESDGTADTLTNVIAEGPVLMLGATSMRTELPTLLRAKGLTVVAVACYLTVAVPLTSKDAQRVRDADVLFIGAPSAWSVARDVVSGDTWVVVPGASTAADVRRDHQRVMEGWGPDLRSRLVELSRTTEA
jgi:uroporphyrinogen-III synthase